MLADNLNVVIREPDDDQKESSKFVWKEGSRDDQAKKV